MTEEMQQLKLNISDFKHASSEDKAYDFFGKANSPKKKGN